MLQCLAMSLPACFHQLTESCLRARHCLSPHFPPHLLQKTGTMLGIKHRKATIHCLKQMPIKIKVKETIKSQGPNSIPFFLQRKEIYF